MHERRRPTQQDFNFAGRCLVCRIAAAAARLRMPPSTYQKGTIAGDDPTAFDDKYHFPPHGEADSTLKRIWAAKTRAEHWKHRTHRQRFNMRRRSLPRSRCGHLARSRRQRALRGTDLQEAGDPRIVERAK